MGQANRSRRLARVRPRVRHYTLGLGLSLVAAACADSPTANGPPAVVSSFEGGMDGWRARAMDTLDGSPGDGALAHWSVSRSEARATDGHYAIRIEIENNTDAAKVWLERELRVEPNRDYALEIEYDFATADFGDLNLFRIIAGGLTHSPVERAELEPLFRDETGHGFEDDQYRWLTKHYEQTVRSSPDGKLFVLVGVWATYEVTRVYFVDRVTVAVR
jgi:hypothetical protein